jgi:hypothetical protein
MYSAAVRKPSITTSTGQEAGSGRFSGSADRINSRGKLARTLLYGTAARKFPHPAAKVAGAICQTSYLCTRGRPNRLPRALYGRSQSVVGGRWSVVGGQ